MQNFDIVTIRMFLSVARKGSIGAAARAEHIAASAVSRRISDLEHNLDVALIRRTASGATLTSAGRAFSRHCEKILNQFAEARVELKKFGDGEAGELRIAAVTAVISGGLPSVIAEFMQDHPAVDVSMSEIFSVDGLRYLREDLADIIIIADSDDSHSFQICHYSDDPVWVVASPNHSLFKKHQSNAPISFVETLCCEHISFHEGGGLDDVVAAAARKAKHTFSRRFNVSRFDTLRRCVQEGLGIGFLRESAARPHLANGSLIGAPLSDDWANRSLVCIYPQALSASPVVTPFLALLDARK